MKKVFTQFFKVIPLVVLALSSLMVSAQTAPTFQTTLQNVVQTTDRTLEFDLYLLNTDLALPMELASYQAGITLNPAIYAGGTLTASLVAGSSTLSNAAQIPTSITFTSSQTIIKLAAKSPPGTGNGSIISKVSPGTRIIRVQLTSTVPFVANTTPNFSFAASTATNPSYPTAVALYLGGVNTQMPVSMGTNASVLENPALNPPVPPTAYAVTGGGSYVPGGVGLPVGLANSEVGVTYTLYKNTVAQVPTVAGTGAAITFGNQLAGTYTVSGSNVNGTTAMTGNAQITVIDFQTTIRNVVQTTDRTLKFDLYLLNNDQIYPIELASYQAGITLNPAIYSGGTLSATIIAGTSSLTFSQVPTSVTYAAPTAIIKLAAKAPPGSGSGSIISQVSPGTRIIRILLTSTVPFATNSTPDFSFAPSTATPPSYPTTVALYVGGVNTQLPVSMGVNASVLENPVLNPPAPPVAYAVTGTGSYCQGGVGLPVGLANSEVGVTYTLYKNTIAQVPTIPGTGAAINFGNQLAGTYTVSGTRGAITTPMTGSATVTENPAPAAPTAALTQPTCALATGTISVTSTVTGLSFSIDGLSYANTTGIFTGVLPGTYSLTAMDAGGCVSLATGVVITPAPTAPAAPTASLIQPTCALATGTISVTSTVTGLSFSIDGISYTNTTGIFAGLVPGTYSLTAMDAGGCVSLATSVVINPVPLPPVPTITGPVDPVTLLPATLGSGITTGQVYTTEPGMTNYVWTVSAAGTITAPTDPTISNSITVTWTNPTGQQFVSVNYTTAGACTATAPTVLIINYFPFAAAIDPLTIPQFVDPVPHFAAGLRVNAKAGGSLTIKEVLVQQVALSTGTVLSTGTIGTTPGAGMGKYAAYAISKDGGTTFGPAMWPAQTIEAQVGNPLTVQYQNKLNGVRYSDFNILADQTLMMNGYPMTGNRLTDPYTGDIPMVVHLHGGEIPSGSDGGPTSWFMPDYSLFGPGFQFGSSSLMSYPNQQEAGTLWYHPHDQGLTRINVYTGLAGYYFLRGPAEEAAHLPGWSGDDKVMEVTPAGKTPTFNGTNTYLPEIELAIQDRMFNNKGELYWPVAPTNPDIHPFWTPEFVGDVMTVNGKSWPYLSVAPRKYRFRLLEGCNARFLNLWLQNLTTGANGPAITVVGSDGALMDAPATLAAGQTLLMAPGERYDVVIDFTAYAGQVLTLMNNAAAPYPTGTPVSPGTTDRIMQFVVNGTMVSATGGTPADKSAVPANLRAANPMVKLTDFAGNLAPGVTPSVKRQIILNEITGAGGPVQVLFNNSHFDASSPLPGAPPDFGGPTELPIEGATEQFTIINTSADAHPIHIHLTQWQLVSRQSFNVAAYMAAYSAAWASNPLGYPEWPVGQGYPGGSGSPLPYNTLNADGAVGGNPAVTPFLTGPVIPATPEESVWKDDVKAYPGEVATFMVRYAPTDKPITAPATDLKYPFDPTVGPGYVWHCHIIDHEDMDMMRPLMIQATTAVLPPQITAQPAPVVVCDGSLASFSVTATSARTISYQWQVSTDAGVTFTNLTNIPPYSGALSQSLSINPATLAMTANQYRVVLTSTDGVTTSNAALLTIDQSVAIAPTAIVTQPSCSLVTGTISVTSTTTGLSFSIDGTNYGNTTGIFTGVVPGSYSLTAKNALGCVSPPANVVVNAVPAAIQLSGTVKYHNAANTPMNNAAVKLVQSGNIIQETLTGIAGDYLFANVCPGTYDVVLTSLKDVGGINSTDAGQANAWNVTQTGGVHAAIEKVRFLGGDVNGNNSILSSDAAMIQQYFLTLGTAPVFDTPWEFWKAGDMITTQPQTSNVMTINITAGSGPVTQNFLGLASGDFNQSFVPSPLKSAIAASQTLKLLKGEIIPVLPMTTIDLPIKAGSAMRVGAISLILNYPEDKLQIEGVFLKDRADQSVGFNTINGELRIGWNSLSPLSVSNGETMLTIRVKTTSDMNEKDVYGFELAANPLNELADGEFNVIPDAALKINELQLQKSVTVGINSLDRSAELMLTSSPNPFKEKAFIKYLLPDNGHVTLEVSGITGNRITVLSNEQQIAGEHSMNLDGGALSPGVYLITLKLENQLGVKIKTIRIIKQ